MTSISDLSNATIKEIKQNKIDNCQELKNLEYKTMLMNGSNITPKDLTNTTDIKITNFLENEKNANKKECWTKLDKTQKIKHINVYCETLKEKDNLTDKELQELKNYIFRCVERKYLLKAKEVNYDKNENKILNLPYLIFDNIERKYTFKKDEKHVSTIKSLPEKKNKTIKIYDK